MRGAARAFCLATIIAATSAPAAEWRDGFDAAPANTSVWNLCGADLRLLSFQKAPGGSPAYLVSKIDRWRENAPCPKVASRMPESEAGLGPSFTRSFWRAKPADLQSRPCAFAERRDGVKVIQRSEIRFVGLPYRHPIEAEHWYSLRFTLEGADGDGLPDCGSVRWVIAQWKYDVIPKGANDSPFLAQRFDNGVLHLTVEDGRCRCMIAKTYGDPDRRTPDPWSAIESLTTAPTEMHEVAPLACRATDAAGEDVACAPPRLKLFAASAGGIPLLPDPRRGFIRMTYRIRAGGQAGTRLDVYADGAFILRAQGWMPAGIPAHNTVLFKFGHYRDKVQTSARMLVDDVCLSATAATCDPGITPLANE